MSSVSRRTLVVGMVATASACLFIAACDEADQGSTIILAAPYAGRANLVGSEWVLEGVCVRLREHGFVYKAGASFNPGGEV